jgi:hypothetical protein
MMYNWKLHLIHGFGNLQALDRQYLESAVFLVIFYRLVDTFL